MIIQYILKEQKNEQEIETSYVLPVTPEEVKKSKTATVNSIAVLNYGSVTSKGNRELEQLELSSFFPSQAYSFVEENLRMHRNKFPPVGCYHNKELLAQSEYIRQFQQLVNSGRPLRIRIDTLVPIWKLFIVKSFHYGASDGSGDISFTLQLIEYRIAKKTAEGSEVKERPQKLPEPDIYVVEAGDTLYAIAARYTGDGEKWRKIASDNNISDPRGLQIGKRLVIK